MPQEKTYVAPSWTLILLRLVLSLHALGVLAQAIFAGQFLSGIEEPVVLHAWTAWFVLGLSAAQIVLAVALIRLGGPLWLVVASVFVVIAEALQTGTGYGRFLGVHIPLGVFVFGAVTWLATWSMQQRSFRADQTA